MSSCLILLIGFAAGGAVLGFLICTWRRRGKGSDACLGNIAQALDSLPSPFFVKDLSGCYRQGNLAWYQLLGLAPEQTLGKTARDLFPPEYAEQYERSDQELLQSGGFHVYELPVLSASGALRDALFEKALIRNRSGEAVGIVGISLDISDRKQRERERDSERELLKTVMEAMTDEVWYCDANHRVQALNQRAKTLLSEVSGGGGDPTVEQILETLHIVGPGNAPRPLDQTPALRALRGESVFAEEERIVDRGGRTRYRLVSSIPLRDGSGTVNGAISVVSDDTERRSLEVQLRQAHRIEAIGTLAAGIAHEINTPAQFVSDNLTFLRDACAGILKCVDAFAQSDWRGGAPSEVDKLSAMLRESDIEYLQTEVPRAIADSQGGMERITKIVRAMKSFAHAGGDEWRPHDINRAIEETVTISRNEWKYTSDVALDLDPQCSVVECIPGEVNQLLLNLVVNAAHAIEDLPNREPGKKGEIRIRTQCDDDWVAISVADTGCGIPVAIRDRVFDPFFTTKRVGKGTGQGLTICLSVVEHHAGQIWFETEEGKGTVFTVRLPMRQPVKE